jgi:hypothetical protein
VLSPRSGPFRASSRFVAKHCFPCKLLHPYKTALRLHTCAHTIRRGRHGCRRCQTPLLLTPATA